MTQKMMETRRLNIDSVYLVDDSDNNIKRDLILEYSNSFPDKLYLQLLSPDPTIEGWMNSFTIEEVENHQVDWSSDEFSRTTFWTKNAGEAIIVASRMYHALKEDGVIGIIPLEGIGE